MFGDTLEAVFWKRRSSCKAQMTSTRIAGVFGGIVGVTLGCALGLMNLIFVDERKADMLKLQALEDSQEFEFEVEIDNAINLDLTTVFVSGPDVDGVLASIIARYNCIAWLWYCQIGCRVQRR